MPDFAAGGARAVLRCACPAAPGGPWYSRMQQIEVRALFVRKLQKIRLPSESSNVRRIA